MNYTHLTLFLLGVLGVILHILVKLNTINRANNGKIDYVQYFKMEWISILIAIVMVFGLVWMSQEISELANAGRWLGLGFITAGYMGQSLLIAWLGKAQNFVDNSIGQGVNTNNGKPS